MSESNSISLHPIFIRYFILNQKHQPHGGTRGITRVSRRHPLRTTSGPQFMACEQLSDGLMDTKLLTNRQTDTNRAMQWIKMFWSWSCWAINRMKFLFHDLISQSNTLAVQRSGWKCYCSTHYWERQQLVREQGEEHQRGTRQVEITDSRKVSRRPLIFVKPKQTRSRLIWTKSRPRKLDPDQEDQWEEAYCSE